MRNFIYLFILFPVLFSSQETAKYYTELGKEKTKAKNNDGAYKDFSKAIKLNPSFTEAYFLRAGLLYKDKIYIGAIRDYTKVIELRPDFAKAYAARGFSYAAQKFWRDAITDYSKAIDLDPSYAMAYASRGFAYETTGRPSSIYNRDYKKACELGLKWGCDNFK